MRRALVLTVVAVFACGTRAKTPSPGSAGEAARGGPPASPLDAGGPLACSRFAPQQANDAAPCVEDCNRGIALGCVEMATRLEHGEGLARDLTRSVSLLERACSLDDAASCVIAARMHASGAGVPPNRTRQMELLASACKLGDPAACIVPARAFANGSGVPRDARRAKELFERGCAGGVESACDAIEDAGGVRE